MFSISQFLLIVLSLAAFVNSDPINNASQKVQAQEQRIRQSVDMTYINYHLYPFAIAKNTQQFVISFHQKQIVRGQVMIHWVKGDQKTEMEYPTFLEQQNINLKIIDTTSHNRVVYQRKFHFETGLKFQAEPEHNYRLIFQNSGEKIKMIQFSLSYVEPKQIKQMTNTTNTMLEAEKRTKTILQQVSNILIETQESLVMSNNIHQRIKKNIGSYMFGCLWEIILIGALLGSQYYMFMKVSNNQSII